MNIKNFFFLFLLLSPASLFCASDDLLDDVLGEILNDTPKEVTSNPLDEALLNDNMKLALELFEKGAPATSYFFQEYCKRYFKKITTETTYKNTAEKILQKLNEQDKKSALTDALSNAIELQASIDFYKYLINNLGAKATETHLRVLQNKHVSNIDENILNNQSHPHFAIYAAISLQSIEIFSLLLNSMEAAPSSDIFLLYARAPIAFAQLLTQKGCKPAKGNLKEILDKYNERMPLQKKEALARIILDAGTNPSEEESDLLYNMFPKLAAEKGVQKTAALLAKEAEEQKRKEDAALKEKERKEREAKERAEREEKIRKEREEEERKERERAEEKRRQAEEARLLKEKERVEREQKEKERKEQEAKLKREAAEKKEREEQERKAKLAEKERLEKSKAEEKAKEAEQLAKEEAFNQRLMIGSGVIVTGSIIAFAAYQKIRAYKKSIKKMKKEQEAASTTDPATKNEESIVQS